MFTYPNLNWRYQADALIDAGFHSFVLTGPSTAVMLRSASQISFVAASRALEGDLDRRIRENHWTSACHHAQFGIHAGI